MTEQQRYAIEDITEALVRARREERGIPLLPTELDTEIRDSKWLIEDAQERAKKDPHIPWTVRGPVGRPRAGERRRVYDQTHSASILDKLTYLSEHPKTLAGEIMQEQQITAETITRARQILFRRKQ